MDAAALQQMWVVLESQNPQEGDLKVLDVQRGISEAHVLLGADEQGIRHLLVQVPTGAEVKTDRHSAGVQVQRHTLLDGELRRNFVDVVCLKPHLHELFAVIASDILTTLQGSPDRPDLAAHGVLDRWRELLDRAASELPGVEKVKGVFGELWCLCRMATHNPEAIAYWTGPDGDRHDFRSPRGAIEVKTSGGGRGWQVEVHGIEQLAPPVEGALHLAVMMLERQPETGASIGSLVDDIERLGVSRRELLTRLGRCGVCPEHIPELDGLRFAVRETRLYVVDAQFPCLTPQSFLDGHTPDRIDSINYRIDLSGTPPDPLGEEQAGEVWKRIAGGAK